jgi:hypothetical protein
MLSPRCDEMGWTMHASYRMTIGAQPIEQLPAHDE